MADLGQIMEGIPTKNGIGNKEIKYVCETDVQLASPVNGTISEVDSNSITITSNDSNKFTIKKVSFDDPAPTKNLKVTKGQYLSAKTENEKVFLISTQDLSPLLGVKPEKEESPTKTKLSTGLGLSREDAKRIATDAVSGTIGISNAPYQATLDILKKLPPLKKESSEIKDNVLSEELKRIKSLF
jgi:hypothetical protein